MLALALSLVFLVLSQTGCDGHNGDDVCQDINTQAACVSPCWWWSDDCGCYEASCKDTSHNTSDTCKGSVDGNVCVWNPDFYCGGSALGCCERASCNDYNHRNENGCKADGECVWDGDNNYCGYPHCDDYDHRTAEKCTGASVDGEPCVWNPNYGGSGRCERAGCSDFEHNTLETCKGMPVRWPCVWNNDYNRCEDGSCGDYDASSCSSTGCTWCANQSRCRSSSSCSDEDEVDCHIADGNAEMCKEGAIYGCTWSESDGKCNKSSAFSITVSTLLITLLLVVFML